MGVLMLAAPGEAFPDDMQLAPLPCALLRREVTAHPWTVTQTEARLFCTVCAQVFQSVTSGSYLGCLL